MEPHLQLVKYTTSERYYFSELNKKLNDFGMLNLENLSQSVIPHLLLFPDLFNEVRNELKFSCEEKKILIKTFETNQNLGILNSIYFLISRIEKSDFYKEHPFLDKIKELKNIDKKEVYVQLHNFWDFQREKELCYYTLELYKKLGFKNGPNYKFWNLIQNYKTNNRFQEILNKRIYIKNYVHGKNGNSSNLEDILESVVDIENISLTQISKKSLESSLLKLSKKYIELININKIFLKKVLNINEIFDRNMIECINEFKFETYHILKELFRSDSPVLTFSIDILPKINKNYNIYSYMAFISSFLLLDLIRFKRIFPNQDSLRENTKKIIERMPLSSGYKFGILLNLSDLNFEESLSKKDGSVTIKIYDRRNVVEGKYGDLIRYFASIFGECENHYLNPHILYDIQKIKSQSSQIFEKKFSKRIKHLTELKESIIKESQNL